MRAWYLISIIREIFARLLILLRGDKRVFAPTTPILFDRKLTEMLARLQRLLRGDKRDYAPTSKILFAFK